MDVDTYQGGGGGLFDKPQRRQHRHRHRRLRRQAAWKRTLAGLSLVAAALVVGGLAVGAAIYFTQPLPPPPAATDDEPKAVTGDTRLVGRWLTDLDATIEQLKEKTPLTDQQELQVRRQRQISVLTFTDTTLTIQIKGKPDTQPYRIVSTKDDRLTLQTWFVASKSEEEIRVRFVGPDICWVEVPKFKLVECYRKIKQPGPVADPGGVPDPLGKEP